MNKAMITQQTRTSREMTEGMSHERRTTPLSDAVRRALSQAS